MARTSDYEALSGADAIDAIASDFEGGGGDGAIEPYGEPGPDEVSWFTGASGAGLRTEREVTELLGRLLGR